VHFGSQYSTAAHTLRVNQQIKEKRKKKALLGGGLSGIDDQHLKIMDQSMLVWGSCYWTE